MLDKELLKNKTTKNKKSKKKSEFSVLPKDDLEFYGKMIMLKQISYNKLLEKIKIDYPNIKTKRSETLRYFMIKNHYVLNEKSLNNINLNIEKSKLIQKKRNNIIQSLLTKILEDEDFLEKLFKNEFVINKIKEISKD